MMSNKLLVPKLRFKEFSEEWEEERFGDISEIVGGGTPSTAVEKYWGGNIQWFTPTEIKSKYISSSKKTITKVGLDRSSAKLLPKGTLLFSSRATIGEIGIASKECTTNQGFQSFVVSQNNEPDFLYNWIIKNKKEFIRRASGSTFLEIGKSEIKKIKINIPQRTEQEKIATFLTAVDNKIEQLNKKQDLLKKYKKSLMQKLFSQKLRFKDKNGNDFPDWEEKTLKELGEIKKGVQLNKSELVKEGKYPAINGGKKPSGYTNKWNSKKNTITISEGGNSCGYINLIDSNFWSGGHCYNIENLKSNILNTFLFQILKLNEPLIMQLRVGSGLPNIQKGDINNFKIKIPLSLEQTKIANLLSSIDKKIEQLTMQLNQSKQFKKSLLQQMFI